MWTYAWASSINLRAECSEMRLRILHPGEDHLGSCERVGDHCFQNLLREGCGKLPWWGETLGLILVTLPLVIVQTPAQLFIHTMELFVSRVRGCKIRLHAFLLRLHAFLLRPRFRHFILQPRIMSMTCWMDISSLAARAEPCLVALILQCFPLNFSSRYGSSDRFPETCDGTDVLNRPHGGRQMFRSVDLGTSLCATLPVS